MKESQIGITLVKSLPTALWVLFQMTNIICAKNIQVGDEVEFKTGSFHEPRVGFFKVTRILDLHNGTLRFYLGRYRPHSRSDRIMDVRKNGEVRIKV